MNEQTDVAPVQEMSAFLPLVLLSISFAVLLAFQVSILLPQRANLQKAIVQNEQAVANSQQVQSKIQKLVMDLAAVAAEDKDAQAIIAKNGIQISGTTAVPATNAETSPAATPAASATPAP